MTSTPETTAPAAAERSKGSARDYEAAVREQQQSTTARDRLVIMLLLVSAFVVILNETIIGVALDAIETDLGITTSLSQWLSTAFMLTMAVVIPTTGFLLQRFSTRAIFLSAMTLFTLGTAIAAVSPGFEMLLAGRIVQASGTAIMMPLLMTTVMTLVAPAQRGATMGTISIVISVAPAIGPSMAGVLLTVLPWRGLFWVMVPIALLALALGFSKIQNVTDPRKVPLDVPSVILAAFAFGGLIYGVAGFAEAARGEQPVPLWIPLVVGGVALLGFILRQVALQQAERALLDLRTFRSRNFSFAIVLMAVSMAALFGSIILLPLYLQQVLLLETWQTGLIVLPGSLLMGMLGPIVGRIFDRLGARVLLVPGTVIMAIVLLGFGTLLTEHTPVAIVIALHVGLSLGLALLFTPLFTSALGSLEPRLYSHGSAIIGTLQQLAGAAGTALFVTLLTVQSVAELAAGTELTAALASGMRLAFLTGAGIAVVAIGFSFFVRKPADSPEGAVGGH